MVGMRRPAKSNVLMDIWIYGCKPRPANKFAGYRRAKPPFGGWLWIDGGRRRAGHMGVPLGQHLVSGIFMLKVEQTPDMIRVELSARINEGGRITPEEWLRLEHMYRAKTVNRTLSPSEPSSNNSN